MLGGSNKYQYLCSAKKGREGLCHQRTKTQAGHRALSEFAKKETLRIVPQQFLTIKRDTVQLTYPMRKYLDFIRRPFEYDKSLCIALVVMLLSGIALHCSDLASALGIVVLAGLYVIVPTNMPPRYFAIATPVLFVMTIVLLSCIAMFPEGFYQTPWTKFARTTISPIWFAGLTVALVMSFIYSWKNLTDTKKASFFGIAITLLLVLVATSDVVRAVLLAVAVCITFYACRIGKDRMFFNCGMTLSGVILYVVGAALFGHNPFGGFNPQYDSEALLRFVPVLTSIYVVYQTTHRLIDRESSYIRLLGIGSAYILLAE